MSPNPRDILVRPARQEDVSLMARWAEAMALETEDKPLDPATVARGIRRAFEDAAKGRYFIAEIDGQPAGTLMLTWEWSDWRDGWWWWIQSVYVAPESRGKGAFKLLHGRIVEEARIAGVVGIRLYVFEPNARAREVYRRLGMRDAGYRVLEQML